MANLITLIRVLMSFLAIIIVALGPLYNFIACILIIFAMLLDAVDGYIARMSNQVSLSGSVYDILADRIIENAFYIFFASQGLFSFWIAIVIMVRGLIIDAIRSLYAVKGKTAFGENTLHQLTWTKLLACSRLSRGAYNTFKLLTFVFFSQLLEPNAYVYHLIASKKLVLLLAHTSLWLGLIIALLRALPVIYEGLKADRL